ncbi:39S ribosomal protein L9, mitochondrial [Toxocara canis]|uniref:Large ribosomal subunit protein bL9m n=1 Tax=Toxocara canis TaxID=6265 RepID=A0A0B2V3D8_TOXCA|nr:39S ribosomal protein L9, mitochondrial [Toxocara canis]
MLFRPLFRLNGRRTRRFEQPFRNTWVLRHVFAPEPTPPGQMQRRPEELPNLMKYEVVDFESKHPAGPLKVILLEDVEGVGQQFDVLGVNRKLARTDLLLSRKAVYASPFDLQYYAAVKEQRREELASRVRIPYDYLLVGRHLLKMVVPIHVSMDNPWTIESSMIRCSLRQAGVDIVDDAIFVDSEKISGPNFEMEARLIRFYVVVCKQYVVPMLGRISHISADDSKQVLYPEASKLPTEKELAKYGISVEEPYYHKTPEIGQDFDVFAFMKTRRQGANNE